MTDTPDNIIETIALRSNQKTGFRESEKGIRLAISLLTNGDFPRYALPVHANSGITLHELDKWYRKQQINPEG